VEQFRTVCRQPEGLIQIRRFGYAINAVNAEITFSQATRKQYRVYGV
jgi:hypothetical protein